MKPNDVYYEIGMKQNPPGTRVRLLRMDDMQSPPIGTEGTVTLIDSIGTVHVQWDTGSTLGLVPGVDRWEVVTK